MQDKQAIQALKAGRLSGLESLVRRYQLKAVRAAYLITQDSQQAEDVAADVFLRICQRIDQFDSSRPFEPYLMRSVVNQALNVARYEARNVSYDPDQPYIELNRLLASPVESPEGQVISRELEARVQQLLLQLTPRERAAIVQRYYLGIGEKEMAEQFSVAPGTVKWILHTARERLRGLLSGERIEP